MSFRKAFIFSCLLFLLQLSSAGPITAKEKSNRTPNPDSYQEYIFDVNDFYKDQQYFVTKVSQYRAYQTAQSKEDALDAAKTMLESGRVALKQYLTILSDNLSRQEEFNPRVKQAILQDLGTHNTYLDNAKDAIISAENISQITDQGKAMDLRITYIKSSASQALGYIDAITTKKRIDESRAIIGKFSNIITGYPPENRSRGIIEKWIEEALPDLANSENQLAQFVDSIYPLPTNNEDKPLYERTRAISNINILQQIVIKQRSYAAKFKEINQIAKAAYQEL